MKRRVDLPELGVWEPLDVQIIWVLPFPFSRLGCNMFIFHLVAGTCSAHPSSFVFIPLVPAGPSPGCDAAADGGGVIGFPEPLQTL